MSDTFPSLQYPLEKVPILAASWRYRKAQWQLLGAEVSEWELYLWIFLKTKPSHSLWSDLQALPPLSH